jgi:uncharacterized SAM-binding protein YcdF (DUF218 family)
MIRRLVVCGIGILGFAVVLSAMLWLSHDWWLTAMGRWLVVDQQPLTSDAIVAVAGQSRRRDYAVELFSQGYASRLIFNVSDTTYYFGQPIDPVTSVLENLDSRGVSRARAIINRDVTSTWCDALVTLQTAREQELSSLIVVSSPLHMRRVKMCFESIFDGSAIRLTYCPVPLCRDKIEIENWWTREREFIKVYNEYLKLIFYQFKYF